MQPTYPKKLPLTKWDSVHITYPVRKFPSFGYTSEIIGRQWRPTPEISVESNLKVRSSEEEGYSRDYKINNELTKSQTAKDFTYKIPETTRFNKHTSCNESLYIYPASKTLSERTPADKAHETSEMRSSYVNPIFNSKLITYNQFKYLASPIEKPMEIFEKEVEPLYTTQDGFEKYLDPFLTINKLIHRPFTTEQLNRLSNTKDILTYYTYSDIPWVRSPKPKVDEWRLPLSKCKSVFDKMKFKSEFREIRTLNKPNWVPRALITEMRDKYVQQTSRPESKTHNYEEEIKFLYQRSIANLDTSIQEQNLSLKHFYKTENSHLGSGRPICTMINQYVKRNR